MHHRPHGDHACASCKHQRKKCKEDCMMAPFFPVQNNKQFRAVHKIFGVSNVAKQLRKHGSEEHRRLSADSLIWEASCWENDPIQGPHGEYQRLVEELNICKNEYYNLINRLPTTSNSNLMYNQPQLPSPSPTLIPTHLPSRSPALVPNGWNKYYNNGAGSAINNGAISNGGTITVSDSCLVSSYTDRYDKGNNVQFNGMVQDLDVQDISGQPPPSQQHAFEEVIQSMGNPLQDQRDRRTNGALLSLQNQMANFNQQLLNGTGQYHPTSEAKASRNAAAAGNLDTSRWP